MEPANPRYTRHELPACEARDAQSWVDALPGLGFEKLIDEKFITLEGQMAAEHARRTGRGGRGRPQAMWLQIWRHEAGAISCVSRFSSDGNHWLYSCVDVKGWAGHGFACTNEVKGAVIRRDGSVDAPVGGRASDDEGMDGAWRDIRQSARQGRLVPLGQWPAMHVPNEVLDIAIAREFSCKGVKDPISSPAERYNAAAAHMARSGVEIISYWEGQMQHWPGGIGQAEKDLWLCRIMQLVEVAFNRTPSQQLGDIKTPGHVALFDQFKANEASGAAAWHSEMLHRRLQERLVGLLIQRGMEPGDPLGEAGRSTTRAWLEAMGTGDGGPAISGLVGSRLAGFDICFVDFMFSCAREDGVVDKIHDWIKAQDDHSIFQACTVPGQDGMTLPIHLARAWMESKNERYFPEKQGHRLDGARRCLSLLAQRCPVEQWVWASDRASAWDWVMGEAINLPQDDDLVGPHQDQIAQFIDWIGQSGARVPGVVFIPGHGQALDLADACAIEMALERAIDRGDFRRFGTGRERLNLIAPLRAYLLGQQMHEQVPKAAATGKPGLRL